MSGFIIFTILIFQVFGYHAKDLPSSIINGDLANIEDHPYYVFLLSENENSYYLCGGSIIEPNLILTAGHCVGGKMLVFTGMTTTDDIKDSDRYKVKETVTHPFYVKWIGPLLGSLHDLALLKLEKNITLGPTAQVIEISKEDPEEDDDVMVVGFGKDKCDTFGPDSRRCTNPTSKHLRSAVLTVTKVSYGQIKTGGIDQHVCKGDSGGPMVYNGKLVGVASIVDVNCSDWNIYTRLSSVSNKKWLENHMTLY